MCHLCANSKPVQFKSNYLNSVTERHEKVASNIVKQSKIITFLRRKQINMFKSATLDLLVCVYQDDNIVGCQGCLKKTKLQTVWDICSHRPTFVFFINRKSGYFLQLWRKNRNKTQLYIKSSLDFYLKMFWSNKWAVNKSNHKQNKWLKIWSIQHFNGHFYSQFITQIFLFRFMTHLTIKSLAAQTLKSLNFNAEAESHSVTFMHKKSAGSIKKCNLWNQIQINQICSQDHWAN